MKKNVKYLGMTAAALLAVAPVVTSGVANAATLRPQESGTNSTQANDGKTQAKAIPAKQNYLQVNANMGTAMGNYLKPVSEASGLQYTGNLQVLTMSPNANLLEGAQTVQTAGSAALVPAGTELKPGLYTQLFTVALKGTPNLWYNINGTPYQANDEGVISGVPAVATIQITDKDSKETPYYTFFATNQVIGDGATANWTGKIASPNNVRALYDLLTGTASPVHLQNGTNMVDMANIKSQLQAQNIKVSDNGQFTVPSTGFVITMTGQNMTSGKKVTVKVPFAGNNTEANVSAYPVISYKGTKIQQGSKTLNTMPLVNVQTGSKFNPTTDFKAVVNSTTGSNNVLDMNVLTNNVNTNVPGVYTVTLRATNPSGYTTTLDYTVVVTGKASNESSATVQYKAGYGVNVWALQGANDSQVAFTGSRVQSGTKVSTFDTKTVNGVEYTRINSKTSNTWIQTQYLDGSYKNSSNTNKGEESVSGVLTVKYDGKGKVGLTNANGKYTGQYVSKNSRWKVFAKKTINGREFYRIGNQNQWIPAEFSELD